MTAALPPIEIVFDAPVVRLDNTSCAFTTEAYTGVPVLPLMAVASVSSEPPAATSTEIDFAPTAIVSGPALLVVVRVAPLYWSARARSVTVTWNAPAAAPAVRVAVSFVASLESTVWVSDQVAASRNPVICVWRLASRVCTSVKACCRTCSTAWRCWRRT